MLIIPGIGANWWDCRACIYTAGSRDIHTSTSKFVSGRQPNGMSDYEQAVLGLFPARVSRDGEAQGHCHGTAAHPRGVPALQLERGSTMPETHFFSYMNCEEADNEEAEPDFLSTGCKGAQGQTTCVRSGPVQRKGAPALSSNDAQFWGRGCWKMGHLGSIGVHLNWGGWDFFPDRTSQGTHEACQRAHTQSLCACRCAMHAPVGAPACSQGSRVLGVTSQSLLAPHFRSVRFYPGLGVGGVFSPSSVCQWRICWLNKAVSSSWLTAPFWSNLLTFFLIFLNSKH